MPYRELINVANGVKIQLDACIAALDLHENPPSEIEDLTGKLESALQDCETIIRKGEEEPDEQSTAAPDAGSTPTESAATAGVADEAPTKDATQKKEIGQVFEDDKA